MSEHNIYKLKVKPPNIFSLIVLSAFASMGAVLITPALPSLAKYFAIPHGMAQLTVTSFLLGYALGQLLYGPIANRLGRKPAFYIGISIATLGSIFSILSSPIDSYALMIVGRFLEALGSSVGLVVCLTIINDFYFTEQARKVTGSMMLAFAIVPGIAVTMGGLLTTWFAWQSCFFFLLAYGFILIYPAITLPETISILDPKALHSRYLFKNYLKMIRNHRLVAFALLYGCSTACNYVYNAEGPFIGINQLHLTTSQYGCLALLPYFGVALGSLFCIRLSGKIAANHMLKLGIALEVGAALIMLASFLLQEISSLSLFGCMFILLIGHAIIVTNACTLGIAQDGDKANASAVVNFLGIIVAVVMTFILGLIHSTTPLLLPILLLVILVGMVTCFFAARLGIKMGSE